MTTYLSNQAPGREWSNVCIPASVEAWKKPGIKRWKPTTRRMKPLRAIGVFGSKCRRVWKPWHYLLGFEPPNQQLLVAMGILALGAFSLPWENPLNIVLIVAADLV